MRVAIARARDGVPQEAWYPHQRGTRRLALQGALRGLPAEGVAEEMGRVFLPAQLWR